MSITTNDFPVDLTPRPDPDPFRYGWRYVSVRDEEGKERTRQVPLTPEDILHPEEGDFIGHPPLHGLIRGYLRDVARTYFADRSDIVVTSDCRVDWGSKYGWIHGPDWALFSGNQKPWGIHRATIKLKDHKAKVECVVQITLATTRNTDFVEKRREYFLVGVPCYIIVDTPRSEEKGPIQLFGFKAGQNEYVEMKRDDRGRLPLGESGLWIGVEDQSVFLEDAQGRRLPDFETWKDRAEQAEDRAKKAEDRVKKAEKSAKKAAERAEEAGKQAAAEHAARVEMEARLKAMEAELVRLKGSDRSDSDK